MKPPKLNMKKPCPLGEGGNMPKTGLLPLIDPFASEINRKKQQGPRKKRKAKRLKFHRFG